MLELPLVVLFEQDGSDEPRDRSSHNVAGSVPFRFLSLAWTSATARCRWSWNSEDDLDLVVVYLDASHERVDDISLPLPIEPVWSSTDPLRKFVEPTKYELKAVFRFVCG